MFLHIIPPLHYLEFITTMRSHSVSGTTTNWCLLVLIFSKFSSVSGSMSFSLSLAIFTRLLMMPLTWLVVVLSSVDLMVSPPWSSQPHPPHPSSQLSAAKILPPQTPSHFLSQVLYSERANKVLTFPYFQCSLWHAT